MLEQLAYKYAQTGEIIQYLINYSAVILGGIIGALTFKSSYELKRAPYFALCAIVYAAVVILVHVNTQFLISAILNRVFWLVVAVELSILIAAGICFVWIATARSKDAYGHGKMAVLSFIPIANFWLLFTPSQNEESANQFPKSLWLLGTRGVVLGLVLSVSAVGLNLYTKAEAERRVAEMAAPGASNPAIREMTINLMASSIETPRTVDEYTVLMRVEPDTAELRYYYEVSLDAENFSRERMFEHMKRLNCGLQGIDQILGLGINLKHIYMDADGEELVSIDINSEVCGM